MTKLEGMTKLARRLWEWESAGRRGRLATGDGVAGDFGAFLGCGRRFYRRESDPSPGCILTGTDLFEQSMRIAAAFGKHRRPDRMNLFHYGIFEK